MKAKLSLLLCCLLFVGCTVLNRGTEKKAQLFSQQLAFWQNLRLDGIAEVNYQQFQFRKTAVVTMDAGVIKLSVIDTGLFGLSPEPFLEAILDSTGLEISSNGSTKKLPATVVSQLVPDLHLLLHPEQMKQYRQAVILQGFFATSSASYTFDAQMRLTRILTVKSLGEIRFTWSNELQSIALIQDEKPVATLKIDTIKKR